MCSFVFLVFSIQAIVQNTANGEDSTYIPTHMIKIEDWKAKKSADSGSLNSAIRNKATTDFSVEAQAEEWLECLRKTISSLIYDGDVDELMQKHSLKLIMNTFNTFSNHSVIVVTVARLLSLPFVVESVSDHQLVEIMKVRDELAN